MSSKTAKSDLQGSRKVVMVAYDGANLMDIAGPLQAFSDARLKDGRPAYQVMVVSESGGLVVTDTGLKLETKRLRKSVLESVDTLLISGCDLETLPGPPASLLGFLAQYLDGPRRLGSICTGAFILAELGVLDGCEATTHWAFCGRLEREYPAIIVKPDAIFVTSGRIWTSAGISAGIDLALAMIEMSEMVRQQFLQIYSQFY